MSNAEEDPSLEDIIKTLEQKEHTMNESEIAEYTGVIEEWLEAEIEKTVQLRKTTQDNRERLEQEKVKRRKAEKMRNRMSVVIDKLELLETTVKSNIEEVTKIDETIEKPKNTKP